MQFPHQRLISDNFDGTVVYVKLGLRYLIPCAETLSRRPDTLQLR